MAGVELTKTGGKASDLSRRTLVGLALGVIAIAALWFGGIALWALAIASTITVGQRVWVVRKQAIAEARTTI